VYLMRGLHHPDDRASRRAFGPIGYTLAAWATEAEFDVVDVAGVYLRFRIMSPKTTDLQ
jgi:hypothetical protein